MPSTYTLNNGIELIGTGEQSGTWGDTTNTNFELLDTALDGQVSVTLAATGSSGSPNTLPISDGASSNGRNRLVIFGDGGDLGGTAFVQLTPNDAEKIIYVRNNLSGSRSILLFQGTYNASNDYEVPAGTTAVVFFNGAGSGAVAANVFNNAHFDALNVVGSVTVGGGVTVTGTVDAGTVEFDNLSGTGAVSVTNILDEDNMASNSATALSTQQSIKAYVDSQVGTVDTLAEILANGNTSGGNAIQMTTTDELQFRDTALKISSSADGQLDIDADTEIEIVAPTVDIDASTAMTIDTAALTVTGAVDLNTSLNVDGTVTADGLTVNSGTNNIVAKFESSDAGAFIVLEDSGSTNDGNRIAVEGDVMSFATGDSERMRISSSGFVGIGTSSPSALLHLSGSDPEIRLSDTTNANYSSIVNVDGNMIYKADAGNQFGNSRHRWEIDGSEKMRIDSSGRVGIGTSPSYTLDIASSGAILNMNSTNSNGIGTIYRNSGTAIGYVGSSKYIHSGTIGDFSIGTASTNNLTFGVNSSEKMRIDSSGRVMIAETSNSGYSGNADDLIVGDNGSATERGISLGSTLASSIRFNDGSDAGVIEYVHSDNSMRFGTTNGTERMRIDSSGNVGIGVTPSDSNSFGIALDVGSTTGGALYVRDTGGSKVGIVGQFNEQLSINSKQSDGNIGFYTGASNNERMRITSTGSVGIGTSSVTAGFVLEGIGDARFGDAVADDAVEIGWSGGGGYAFVQAFDRNAAAQRDLLLNSSLHIDSEGRVGIGITPAAIADNTGVDSLQLGGSFLSHFDEDGPGSTILGNNIYYNGTANKALFTGATSQYYQAGGTHVWRNSGSTSAGSTATMTESMRIDSSGSLLINRTSKISDEKLSVKGEIRAGYTASDNQVYLGVDSANAYLGTNASGFGLKFEANGSERMRIDSSGNLLFNGNGVLSVQSSSNNLYLGGGTYQPSQVWIESGSLTAFKVGGSERMRIDSSGNLLVGSSGAFTSGGANSGGNGAIMVARENERCLFLKRSGGSGTVVEFIRGGITNPVGSVSITTSSTSYNTSSDYRLKENVVDLTGATDRLKQLEPKRFNFTVDAGTTVDGFLAHEVQAVVPEAVTGTHNEVDDDGNPVYQGIDQSKLVPLLVATIQELEARITALENA